MYVMKLMGGSSFNCMCAVQASSDNNASTSALELCSKRRKVIPELIWNYPIEVRANSRYPPDQG